MSNVAKESILEVYKMGFLGRWKEKYDEAKQKTYENRARDLDKQVTLAKKKAALRKWEGKYQRKYPSPGSTASSMTKSNLFDVPTYSEPKQQTYKEPEPMKVLPNFDLGFGFENQKRKNKRRY